MYCLPYPQGSMAATPLYVPYLATSTLTYLLSGPFTFKTFYTAAIPLALRGPLMDGLTEAAIGEIGLLCISPGRPSTSLIQTWLSLWFFLCRTPLC